MTARYNPALDDTIVSRLPNDRPSLRGRVFNRLLRLLPMKKRWSSAEAVNERVRRLALNPPSHAPAGLGKDIDVRVENEPGWPVYHTSPAGRTDVRNHAVFLHGGGYIEEIVPPHWRFVDFLTREGPTRCVVPIFPLAPRATAGDIVPALGRLLQKLLDEIGPDNVSVVGNSAGAGLAVAVAQWLRDHGHPQPRVLVLISPWLDASVSRKEQAAIAPVDPVQDIPGLIEAGRLYAGDLPVSHPFVSPLNGAFHSLAPMVVFSGTHDLLHPDSIALRDRAAQAGAEVDLHVKGHMPHNYALLPTPEGREARALVARIVGRTELPRKRTP